MAITLRTNTDGVDWQALDDLFRRADMSGRSAAKLKRAFENSYQACFVYEDFSSRTFP